MILSYRRQFTVNMPQVDSDSRLPAMCVARYCHLDIRGDHDSWSVFFRPVSALAVVCWCWCGGCFV